MTAYVVFIRERMRNRTEYEVYREKSRSVSRKGYRRSEHGELLAEHLKKATSIGRKTPLLG